MLDSLCDDTLLEVARHTGTRPRDHYAGLRMLSCVCTTLREALRQSVADSARAAALDLVQFGARNASHSVVPTQQSERSSSATAPSQLLCNLSHASLTDFDAELLALAIAKNLLRAQSLWLQGNRIGPVGLNSLALGLRKAPETSPLRSLSLGGNEFHRALDAPAADVRARRSRRKAERALARAQQAARHRKVVLRPHS